MKEVLLSMASAVTENIFEVTNNEPERTGLTGKEHKAAICIPVDAPDKMQDKPLKFQRWFF
jgi:hypothetical protein